MRRVIIAGILSGVHFKRATYRSMNHRYDRIELLYFSLMIHGISKGDIDEIYDTLSTLSNANFMSYVYINNIDSRIYVTVIFFELKYTLNYI